MLLPVSGYVLAGGRSLRMGRDKALLELDGRTLAERAVETLGAVCERVRVVGAQAELRVFAPTVQDAFVGCGPLAGIEAALRDSEHDWLMVLPVDLAFLPAGLLRAWAGRQMEHAQARICWLEADGYPQPLVAMLRREVSGKAEAALRAGMHKVTQFYREAGMELAEEMGPDAEEIVRQTMVTDAGRLVERDGTEIPWTATKREMRLRELWFRNLNTPEDMAAAAARLRETDGTEETSKLVQS